MTDDARAHPYQGRPARRFWSRSVSDRHFLDLQDLWTPMPLARTDRVATAGSCFAQHIGRALARRGARIMDLEPAPRVFADEAEAQRWGYGVFSCRTGNVYTARQLLQLFHEAFGHRPSPTEAWERGGRHFDPLRPGVDPVGQADAATVLALRERHLDAVRTMFRTLDVFVMTMGLTEAWRDRADGTVFPTAPGTIAGTYDESRHAFVNFRYGEVHADMTAFWTALRAANPTARMLLTVSPVPLAATAADAHVLVATTGSKSTLRAVAGDLAAEHDDVHYFPAYEIVTAPPGRGMFFDPDWRGVNAYGVEHVMSHFFRGPLADEFDEAPTDPGRSFEAICDEEAMFKAAE